MKQDVDTPCIDVGHTNAEKVRVHAREIYLHDSELHQRRSLELQTTSDLRRTGSELLIISI